MPRMATQLRLDEMSFLKIRAIAAHELRSLNAQMEYFLLKSIEDYEKENGPVTQMKEYFLSIPEQP